MRTYSVLTWDPAAECYTPQEGMSVPCVDVPLHGMRRALKELRELHGYSCHRRRAANGSHDDNDFSVLVERTDGDVSIDIDDPLTLSPEARDE